MRIYPARDGKQLLCDLRGEGGGRDIPLGTLDVNAAAVRAAQKLTELQLGGKQRTRELLLPGVAGYRLSHALGDLVAHGDARSAHTREMHRKHARHLLRAFGDPEVETAPWWDLVMEARKRWGREGTRFAEEPISTDTMSKRESTLSRALSVAYARQKIGRLPALPQRPKPTTIARGRWLLPEESVQLVRAIFQHPGSQYTEARRQGRAARVLIRSWLGMDSEEADKMTVGHFNVVTGQWTRPRRSKTGVIGAELPMPDPMRAVVAQWLESDWGRRLRDADKILPRWPNEVRGLAMYCQAIRIPRVVPKDYRRTAAHWLRMCGYDRYFVARWLALSPASPMLQAVYLQDDPRAQSEPGLVRELLQRFSGAVRVAPSAPLIAAEVTP